MSHLRVANRAPRESHNLRCVICGSTRDVERNHAGGKRHVAWFTMPFCLKHHTQFHKILANGKINLKYTSDSVERKLRALDALAVCQWVIQQSVRNDILERNKPTSGSK